MNRKLKVGIVLDSPELWAWQAAVLEKIKSSEFAELAVVVFDRDASAFRAESSPRRPMSLLKGLIGLVLRSICAVLEAKISCRYDAFRRQDGRALLAHTAIIHAELQRGGDGSFVNAEDVLRIRQFGLDVLVSLTLREFAAQAGAVANCGIWFFSRGEYRSDTHTPLGFWEVYFGWPASTVLLNASGGPGEPRRRVIAHSVSATNRLSVKLNRSTLLWKAVCMLTRKLEQLHRSGEQRFFDPSEQENAWSLPPAERLLGSPTNLQTVLHISRNVSRRSRELLRRKFTLPQWILSCNLGEGVSTAAGKFQKLVPPKDRFWADPHVVERDGRYYVFIEEHLFASEKAHISVIEIDRAGRHSKPLKVLERPYHLSYPFVFEHQGELFMVPESSENRTVELYRCARFPDKWLFVRNLMEGITAVDSTLLHHEGKWWLFTNVIEHPGVSFSEELFLFHSDSILSGEWTPHRLNPVISDVSRSRPAGPILSNGGKLYRVCQDCSVRYGYAIRINQIMELNEHSYCERAVAEITPDWDRRIVATHTLSYAAGLTVIDCLQPRLRLC
jgi:hypothetical protein